MPEYAERVQAGMARLDGHFGDRAGWREGIDIGTLDVHTWYNCVLGQLFDDFDAGMAELGIDLDEATDLGFYLPDEQIGQYPDLTEAWVTALTA